MTTPNDTTSLRAFQIPDSLWARITSAANTNYDGNRSAAVRAALEAAHPPVGSVGSPAETLDVVVGTQYGSEGKGLDIVSGSVNGDKVVMGINRNQLNGAMVASLRGNNKMNITISVKVEDQMVPVIGLSLDRDMDSIAVGSIAQPAASE